MIMWLISLIRSGQVNYSCRQVLREPSFFPVSTEEENGEELQLIRKSAVLYVNANVMPWILKMVDISKANSAVSGEGELVYQVNCAVCHGTELQGDPTGTFPDLRKVSEKFTEKRYMALIDKGKGVMPSFKQIPVQEKEALVSFLTGNNPQQVANTDGNDTNSLKVPYTTTGYNRFLDQLGYPAVKPPWGTTLCH